MVARIVCGKSIRGILNYNENKIKNAEAELLLAHGFPRSEALLSFRNKLERFEFLTRQNMDTRTNAMHITLNFSNRDVLENDLLVTMAREYMERIGFGDQPFLVYRHYDAAHPHIHIATVNIADGGGRIETHNIGRNQSEHARKKMEICYGLIRAEDQKNETAYYLRPADLQKAVYGRSETKAVISAIVREVTSSYKFTSIAELNAALSQFNVMAYQGEEGSIMREKNGLTYHIINERMERMGMPIKASSIFSSPTLKNLEKKYQSNETARKPYGQRLRYQLDKAVGSSRDIRDMEDVLRGQGIRILLRKNAMGNVYGVTFIDNGTRTVFNGSDLGKGYGAGAFMDRLERSFGQNMGSLLRDSPVATPEVKAEKMDGAATYHGQQQPVIIVMHDRTTAKSGKESQAWKAVKIRKGLRAD